MQLKFELATLILCMMTIACDVPIHIEGGTISPAIEFSGFHKSAQVGRVEFVARLHVPRSSLQYIADRQLYSYIYVRDCGNGHVDHSIYPSVEHVRAHDFEALQALLRSNRAEHFTLNGTFVAAENYIEARHCLTLDGGGYFFTTIRANEVVANADTPELR